MDQALHEAAADDKQKQLEEKTRQQQIAAEALLARPRDLAEAITTKLADTSLKDWKINDRPAKKRCAFAPRRGATSRSYSVASSSRNRSFVTASFGL